MTTMRSSFMSTMPQSPEKQTTPHWARAYKRAVTASLAVVTVLAGLLGQASATPLNYDQLRYNQVRMKQIHNAMQTEEPIPDMILYHDVRSLEFDIHNAKGDCGTGQVALTGDWWLYHSGDCFSEHSGHTAETLSDALKEVQTFHSQNPRHEVFTFYIDQHDDFEPGRMPEDLDKLIDKFFHYDPVLANSDTFTPLHLLVSGDGIYYPIKNAAACPCGIGAGSSLQSCVDGTYPVAQYPACQWPLLSTLQGKIIFVLTGGNDHADEYTHGYSWRYRRAFATYDHEYVTSYSAWISLPDFPYPILIDPLGYDLRPWEVFFNQDHDQTRNRVPCDQYPADCGKDMPHILNSKHMISRSYGSGANKGTSTGTAQADWSHQVHHGVQIIGTDDVNETAYPYASTHNPLGFPFDCNYTPNADCGTREEDLGAMTFFNSKGDLLGAKNRTFFNFLVTSGDIDTGSKTDSFAFAERNDPSDHDYSLEVLVPSSWTEDWAKGCLMARRHRGATSAYFAVCRTANSHQIQVQYRLVDDVDSDGGDAENLDTVVKTVSLGGYGDNGIPIEGIAFIRMRSSSGGTHFFADASRDGVHWTKVGDKAFPVPLHHKGIAVTSHGSPLQTWRFDQFKINGVQSTPGRDFWLIGNDGSVRGNGNAATEPCNSLGCTFFASGSNDAQFFHFGLGWGE